MVRASLAFSLLSSQFGLLLQLASTAYIARVLTPEEAGVLAVAAVFLSLAVSFRDFGVAEYLIQHQSVSEPVLRATMAVNFVSSWAMAALLAMLAPLVAWLYGSESLASVLLVQALCLVLIPFGAVTLAWFRREMSARPLFVSQLVAQVAQAGVSVVGVAAGWGVMALAWGSVAGVLATVVVAGWYRPQWFPRWPSWRGTREIFHFGRFATGVFVANQLGRGAPDLFVGRLDSLAAAGMFSRANGVVEIFNRIVMQVVQPVCMPYLAGRHRRDGGLTSGYLRATTMLTGLGWPCLALLALCAFPVIRLIYGPQWVQAVPVAQLLCLAAAMELTYRLTEEALFVLGNARGAQGLMWRVQSARVLGVLVGVVVGARGGNGLAGAAWGLVAAAGVGALLSQHALDRWARIDASLLWRAVHPSLLLVAVSASPVVLLHWAWPVKESNYLTWGAAAAGAGTGAWLAAAFAFKHPLWDELVRTAKQLRGRLTGAASNPIEP